MFCLNLIIKAPDNPSPRQILVDRFPFQIGRALENDLPLPFASISSRHLVLDLRNKSDVVVTDLGSTNGTRIHNQPLAPNQPETVNFPCHLRLGDILIEVEPAAEQEVAFTFAQSETELREMLEDVVRESDVDDDSKAYFEILSGPGSGHRFYLEIIDRPIIIGTDNSADLTLALPDISTNLGSVDWHQSRCRLTPQCDFICFDGRPLDGEHYLQSGDRFVISTVEIRFFDPLEEALESINSNPTPSEPQSPSPDEVGEPTAPPPEEARSEPSPAVASGPQPPAPAATPEPASAPESTARRPLKGAEIAMLVMSFIFLLGTIGLLWILFSGP